MRPAYAEAKRRLLAPSIANRQRGSAQIPTANREPRDSIAINALPAGKTTKVAPAQG